MWVLDLVLDRAFSINLGSLVEIFHRITCVLFILNITLLIYYKAVHDYDTPLMHIISVPKFISKGR